MYDDLTQEALFWSVMHCSRCQTMKVSLSWTDAYLCVILLCYITLQTKVICVDFSSAEQTGYWVCASCGTVYQKRTASLWTVSCNYCMMKTVHGHGADDIYTSNASPLFIPPPSVHVWTGAALHRPHTHTHTTVSFLHVLPVQSNPNECVWTIHANKGGFSDADDCTRHGDIIKSCRSVWRILLNSSAFLVNEGKGVIKKTNDAYW